MTRAIHPILERSIDGGRRPAATTRRAFARRGMAIGLIIWLAAAGAGCSGRGTYITGGPSAGQLKTSLSRLEYENDQLKTQVARLKQENRSFEDRLVQEQIHSGDLAARLDDARNLIRDRGYEFDDMGADAPIARPRTLPAGQTTPRRKPPTARIPAPSYDDDEIPPLILNGDQSTSRNTRQRSSRRDGDSVSLRVDDDFRWIPVASGDKK